MEKKKNDFLLEDDEVPIKKKPKKKITDGPTALEIRKKKFKKSIYITAITLTIISALLFGFGIVWQGCKTSMMEITNALWLTFGVLFFVAWIFFVYNKNILSPVIHGFKVFGLMLVGKRAKDSYYDYKTNIEENPIPKFIYIMIFIFAFLILIAAIITTVLVLQ